MDTESEIVQSLDFKNIVGLISSVKSRRKDNYYLI